MKNRLEKIAQKLSDAGLNVMQNRSNNGIICGGFYIYDKTDHFRIFKGSDWFTLNLSQSVVDFISNNSGCTVVTDNN